MLEQEMTEAGFSLWFHGPRLARDRFLLVFGKKPWYIRPILIAKSAAKYQNVLKNHLFQVLKNSLSYMVMLWHQNDTTNIKFGAWWKCPTSNISQKMNIFSEFFTFIGLIKYPMLQNYEITRWFFISLSKQDFPWLLYLDKHLTISCCTKNNSGPYRIKCCLVITTYILSSGNPEYIIDSGFDTYLRETIRSFQDLIWMDIY